jgi:hypothetical protein
MEALGTALLTDDIPDARAVTTILSRVAVADALRESSPELFLDLEQGDERSTVGIRWTHDELEQLLDRASGDDILFTFDRDQLQLAFDDVEAHGLREKALVFTVAVAGAIGSGAAIANAAPTIERDSSGAASIATVQALATSSADTTVSNARTPGLQIGDETAPAAASSVRAAGTESDIVSNAHTPGLQVGPDETMASAAAVKLSAEPRTSVAGTSDGEFLGVDSRDVTNALIAGGVLLAIAGAGFAGTRATRPTRPA